MKNILQGLINSFLLFIFCLSFTGCLKDSVTRTYKINVPVYKTLASFRSEVKAMSPEALSVGGKITTFGHFLFISEADKGIHIIDNSDPSQPKNVSFINVPGNEDLAVKGNTLYADSYGDLVTFDISDPAHAVTKTFVSNVFQDRSIYYTGAVGAVVNPDSINVIVGWTQKDTTSDDAPGGVTYPPFYADCSGCSYATLASAAPNVSAAPAKTGTSGSLTRFSIINNFMYTVGFSNLNVFNISEAFNPVYKNALPVDWHVETIYALKNMLFIGSNNGMFMYDVQSSPDLPVKVGEFTHVRACDPVVANDHYAYVTLNDSSACLGANNQLQIVDITDLSNSFLVKAYNLTHPVGLTKNDHYLFVCDGRDGLKIFDASDVNNLVLLKKIDGLTAYDVIAENGLLIITSPEGIFQYNYSDINNIKMLSKL